MNAVYPSIVAAGAAGTGSASWWVQAVDVTATFDRTATLAGLSGVLVGDPAEIPDAAWADTGSALVVECSAVDAASAVQLAVPEETEVGAVVVWADTGSAQIMACWLDRRRDRRPVAGVASTSLVPVWWPPSGVILQILT